MPPSPSWRARSAISSPSAVFLLVPIFAVLVVTAVLSIPAKAIALAVFALFMPETANGEERLELAPEGVAAALANPPAG